MGNRTPLYDRHLALGARMVDFGGWDMPVQYPTGILSEHAATRAVAGLFDTCHMGEFILKAPDVRAALDRMLPCAVRNLKTGRARYTFLTAADGGVVDDAVVFLRADDQALICVNAGDIEGDFAHLQQYLPAEAGLENASDATGKLDVQGPAAHEVVLRVLKVDFRALPFFGFAEHEWDDAPVLLSRSGYTGEPGVELFLPADRVGDLWDTLLDEGDSLELHPCGLGARDTLRLEAGLPLYGHELDRTTNPIQAGFAKFVALDKPEDFPGKEALQTAANEGPKETLVGLRLEGKRVPREGFAVLRDGETVGRVTSGSPAPTVGGSIALAYLAPAAAAPGTAVEVEIRGRSAPATVVELPFYSTPSLRTKSAPDG